MLVTCSSESPPHAVYVARPAISPVSARALLDSGVKRVVVVDTAGGYATPLVDNGECRVLVADASRRLEMFQNREISGR